MRKSITALSAFLLLTTSAYALADNPGFIGYPAPGGTTASGSGNTIQTGGRNLSYSGFDDSAYGDLYYAIGSYAGPVFTPGAPGLYEQSNPSLLSFNSGLSNLSQGVAVWSGTTLVPTIYGSTQLYTAFVLTITDSASQALALDDPTLHGLAASTGAVLHVTGDFKAKWQFLASATGGVGTFTAAGPLYDSLSYKLPTDVLRNNVGGAFYATAPVPEPATYGMLLAGLGMLVAVGARRKRHAP